MGASLYVYGPHDCVVLRARDEFIAQAAFRVLNVGITNSEREIESALVVLGEHVKLPFGRGAVALAHFVRNRIESESDFVGANQFVVGIEFQAPLTLADDDARIG